jgi:hypothetical protein
MMPWIGKNKLIDSDKKLIFIKPKLSKYSHNLTIILQSLL